MGVNGRRLAAIVLLCVIAIGAVVLSFSGLTKLGELAGYGTLAWIFAVVVDAGAAASTIYWLGGASSTRQGAWARGMAVALLAVSVAGNFAAHTLVALPAFWMGVVAIVPPATLAAVVHLLAMPGGELAAAGDELATAGDGESETRDGAGVAPPGTVPLASVVTGAVAEISLAERVRRMLDEDPRVGRPRVRAALGVTDHQARKLLEEARAA